MKSVCSLNQFYRFDLGLKYPMGDGITITVTGFYPKYSLPYLLSFKSTLPRVHVSKTNWMGAKQCRPRSDAAFRGVWSGFTLFAQALLSE